MDHDEHHDEQAADEQAADEQAADERAAEQVEAAEEAPAGDGALEDMPATAPTVVRDGGHRHALVAVALLSAVVAFVVGLAVGLLVAGGHDRDEHRAREMWEHHLEHIREDFDRMAPGQMDPGHMAPGHMAPGHVAPGSSEGHVGGRTEPGLVPGGDPSEVAPEQDAPVCMIPEGCTPPTTAG